MRMTVLYLTYAEDVPGNNNTFVMFATFTSAIVPEIQPKRMPGTPAKDMQQYPSISVREKNVTIAWHDLRSNPLGDIYVTTSHNYGQLFADGVKVSGPEPTKHWYPSVNNLPSGKVFIVWQEERGVSYDIIGSVSTTDDYDLLDAVRHRRQHWRAVDAFIGRRFEGRRLRRVP